MKVLTLWTVPHDHDPEAPLPEIVAVEDEFSNADNWGEHWTAEQTRVRDEWDGQADTFVTFNINVDENHIRDVLNADAPADYDLGVPDTHDLDVRILFAQRRESYPGQYGPEALTALLDTFVRDDPERWDAMVVQAKETNEPDQMAAYTELVVRVPSEPILAAIFGTQELEGFIRPANNRQ